MSTLSPSLHVDAPLPQAIDASALQSLAHCSHGTLLLHFSSTIDGTLLRIDGARGHIELSIAGGRIDGAVSVDKQERHIDAEDTLGIDDGKPHTLGLVASEEGLALYLDGYAAFHTTPIGWFEQLEVQRIATDPAGIMQVHALDIFDEALQAPQMVAKAHAAAPFVEFAASHLSDRDAQRCSALHSGAWRARFRSRGLGQGGTIIQAGGEHGTLTLELIDGGLRYSATDHATTLASVEAPGHWDDGEWHDVVLVSGRGALVLYVDGYQVALAPGACFFADVAPIKAVTVGMNLEQSRLFGEAQTAAIFDAVLSDAQVKRLAGVSPIETRALFDTGFHGSKSYRIPSLLRLASGVILAGADRRVSIANDSPNDIDFVLRRSLDDGQTWEPMQTLIEYPGEGRKGASVIDSVLVQDRESGKVIVLIDHFPGGIGQPNCEVGTGFDDQQRMLLHNRQGEQFALSTDGSVVTLDGQSTEYRVDAKGNVYQSDQPAGNIYLAYGVDPNESLFSHRSAYVQMITSDDDGETWSDPVDITADIKAPWMRFIGTSPGNGIQLRHGEHAGRILVPAYYNHEEGKTFSCCALYSDDLGSTWHRGASPNDGRELFGATLDSRALEDDRGSLHESVLVEDSQGRVHVYMRNQHPSGRVGHAVSTDGGATFGEVDYHPELTEIFSQPNAIEVEVAGKPAVVFANASQMLPFRGCGVLRLSFDEGRTWPHNRVFQPRHYVYQCMTQLANGDIGLLWERETQGLFFSRIPLSWLLASRQTSS
ncbi:exo-alpha-sialidase [Corynebacterium pseudopelargi]|uniref:exo-alpha-sialidase n=1 Tax=Corynebacterium pseudopelargi TaxID=2080757 RepID=A0A3G6IUR8_9CORY|nr:exo-alpha-sialidase [Corynebacterium pseudopelargi]AZA09383.1 Sialidase A precursor [Corynebacterium pseudopelargi]